MEASFWHERWSRDEIGFHQSSPNEHLLAYASSLGVNPGETVLVPLCGKSLDMLWLAEQGYRVCGIEINRRAVQDFFAENDLAFDLLESDYGKLYRSGTIEIWCADFLRLDPDVLPAADAVYDRAALIALPARMRPAYVEQLNRLARPGVNTLLVTLEYHQNQMKGPPFSVTEEEVSELFGRQHEIRQLHASDCLVREPRFREKGLSRLDERVFLLTRSASGGAAAGL